MPALAARHQGFTRRQRREPRFVRQSGHDGYLQCSGSLARTSADRPWASTSTQSAGRVSGGTSRSRIVLSRSARWQRSWRAACHRPPLSLSQSDSGKLRSRSSGPGRGSGVGALGQHVQGRTSPGVLQAEQGQPEAVQLGQGGRQGGVAVAQLGTGPASWRPGSAPAGSARVRAGRCAGGTAMPWPFEVQAGAQRGEPGRDPGLSGDSASAASRAATMSPNPAAMARRGRAVDEPASGPRRGNPGVPVSSRSASMIEQVLARAEPHGADADRPPGLAQGPGVSSSSGASRTQVDADRLAVRRGDAEPADMVSGGAGLRLIMFGHSRSPLPGVWSSWYRPPRSSVTVNWSNGIRPGRRRPSCGLQGRGAHPPRRDEPRARAGLGERHEAQLAADGARAERDRQPDRNEPVGSFLTSRLPRAVRTPGAVARQAVAHVRSGPALAEPLGHGHRLAGGPGQARGAGAARSRPA